MITVLADGASSRIGSRPVVLVPIGSTEQHGPHLPLSTDVIVAEAVARAAALQLDATSGHQLVITPALPYGASGEHQAFAGTVSIGHEALRVVLVELIRSLSTWAGRIVLVNGHGGNAPTLRAVVEQMRSEGHLLLGVTCAVETPTDAHAGHDETSVLLHLRPDLVALDRAEPGNTAPLAELLPRLIAEGVRPVSANGVLGDPTRATPAEGRRLFDEAVAHVTAEVDRWLNE